MQDGSFEASRNLLVSLQKRLVEADVDAVLIRSTDNYFNEYVPLEKSIRAKFTGFTGSVGDALVTQHEAHLIVDGRYSLQAKKEAEGYIVHVTTTTQSIESCLLQLLPNLLKKKGAKVAYDPATVDISLFERTEKALKNREAVLLPIAPTLWASLLFLPKAEEISKIWEAPKSLCGLSLAEKIQSLATDFDEGLAGFLIVKLDDIAWLTNLRGTYFPFQMTFPSIACLKQDQVLLGTVIEAESLSSTHLKVVKEAEFFDHLPSFLGHNAEVGVDKKETSKAHEMALQKAGFRIREKGNPVQARKANKNEQELHHLRMAFKKADEVVWRTQESIAQIYQGEGQVSEADVDRIVRDQFHLSGAIALSFRPICAAEKNGAYIHYGSPDNQTKLKEGTMFLLDTGGYYEGGFATDLTRTFLLGPNGKATPEQKEMFTLVLKASIAGMSARIRRGTTGQQLDAIVRACLWQRGLDFAHGTGHGVGINVHEFPPRIAPGSSTVLMEHQVFSIEPGLYFAGIGGVRIENLVTVVKDPDNENFLRILPLTFSPLDKRLIDDAMLDAYEKSFLKYYDEEWHNDAQMPNLPPMLSSKYLG